MQKNPLEWKFVAVTDLDHKSRNPEKFSWVAYLQTGSLYWNKSSHTYTVTFGRVIKLSSNIAVKNRSMELSAIEFFNGRMLAFCDRSGIVFDIDLEDERADVITLIRTGDGNQRKPFKTEWVTIKDNKLVIGSNGREWTDDKGNIISAHRTWIKTMDLGGKITNINWGEPYQRLRTEANCSFPGYLIHESACWDAHTNRWIFLPRKVSHQTPYDESVDEVMSGNTLLISSSQFDNIEAKQVGPLELDWGFTAMKLIPMPQDSKLTMLLGIKVKEVQGEPISSKLAVFDLQGKLYTVPSFIDFGQNKQLKYEGIAFVPDDYRHYDLL